MIMIKDENQKSMSKAPVVAGLVGLAAGAVTMTLADSKNRQKAREVISKLGEKGGRAIKTGEEKLKKIKKAKA